MSLLLNEEKKYFRNIVKQRKSEYTPEELRKKSNDIFQWINNIKEVQEAKIILAYWSLDDEVYTHDWILQQHRLGKTILLPSVEKDHLILKHFEGLEKMVEQPPFGIKESVGRAFDSYHNIHIVLVPGIAFDYNLNRLGRGKGYYDRFLPNVSCIKIGLAFDFQLFNCLPVSKNDIKMDMVVCESQILSISK
ncbi:MAG: 5-formyltetrahydrofolate cyclo-ligase [Bacteroidales bacterium]|nr:5-formyltetrahydrofolate cyclo-ligase [Bacteroidales bacterium]